MKTRQLTLGTLLALTLLMLTLSAVYARQYDWGTQLFPVNKAPVGPNANLKPHGDAWTDFYLDKGAATTLPLHVETESLKIRGGLAEAYAERAKPVTPRLGIAPHSDAWNAFYFDRNVNDRIASPVSEEPQLWRGGMANDTPRLGLTTIMNMRKLHRY
jgi:hypothetical protein